MTNIQIELSRYADNETITSLLKEHKISKAEIINIIGRASKDRLNNKISFKSFSLIAMNLYFEGYKRIPINERNLPKKVGDVLEAFSDPHGKYLDKKTSKFSKEMQKKLLEKLNG